MRKEKEIKSIQIGKEDIKISPFANDIIINIKKSQVSTKQKQRKKSKQTNNLELIASSTRSQHTRSAYKNLIIHRVNKHMETKAKSNTIYDCSKNKIHRYKFNKACAVFVY